MTSARSQLSLTLPQTGRNVFRVPHVWFYFSRNILVQTYLTCKNGETTITFQCQSHVLKLHSSYYRIGQYALFNNYVMAGNMTKLAVSCRTRFFSIQISVSYCQGLFELPSIIKIQHKFYAIIFCIHHFPFKLVLIENRWQLLPSISCLFYSQNTNPSQNSSFHPLHVSNLHWIKLLPIPGCPHMNNLFHSIQALY